MYEMRPQSAVKKRGKSVMTSNTTQNMYHHFPVLVPTCGHLIETNAVVRVAQQAHSGRHANLAGWRLIEEMIQEVA